MSSLWHDFQRFGRELSAVANAAGDLWTWLPSHARAKKHHGDYASEHTPNPADVMREAATLLACLTHGRDWPLDEECLVMCSCGEDFDDDSIADANAILAEFRGRGDGGE